ncbi:hypothetical protein [Clostridium saccharobutylicum]|uniref:hypothetical protein n=1 Tax=Clostridium saccharobutylicum TaxID=169679 RepID=UPI00098C32D5|nr:hypothetical protein [Clostridium saccharobutylicum]
MFIVICINQIVYIHKISKSIINLYSSKLSDKNIYNFGKLSHKSNLYVVLKFSIPIKFTQINVRIRTEIANHLKFVKYENIILDEKNHSIGLKYLNQTISAGGIVKEYIVDEMKKI